MKREFVVIVDSGFVSLNAKGAQPEKFRTFKAAQARAEELAGRDPGKQIGIFELTAISLASVNRAATTRKHPIEHYT